MAELDGVRVLIVTSNTGVERDELLVPRDRLRERGARVTHAAPKPEQVQTFQHDLDPAQAVEPDSALDGVDADDFDVLVVPGGTVNADKLRLEDRAVALAKDFAGAGKPIAAICHGPWLLAEADLVSDKTLTSYPSLRTDLGNAGGRWVDEPVVRSTERDWTLITSRNPGDLDDFVTAIVREVSTR
ncbi:MULTISPECIES: type 1 glutamine amidotransferase domain-containing protein [Nocardia]|uniref:type 1 glutamine amidotransferase domain-containing protein n=1 Tax=Nocardia TaxID=1817 RepID=UPI000BF0C6EB|nr:MULTISPECIES: type 1 glutamine amidotransferase domain-containing protein [Nocardia]MBF6185178.1 type 1 glutamine amidotransferase [Nocardia farcinica]MBF6256922.1 type 1 glutamine amidotransferase [Nocardia farcinica]MBF6267140.1 type 1 glutamine amidotransferase [Nocardia farcinica]MBF6311014.1 type 1 glutamine amidotransferase [Nocardia farcinica]MBF6407633.1 type 1 glutamine amidotransferase [Nocardia farcinica]